MMKCAIYQVDAFTRLPFAGNPAAVCFLPKTMGDSWLQAVAAEMNLSETAFVLPEGDGYRLRWFTPRVEVDLCGHATLATAHLLWELHLLQPEMTGRFYTRSGLLSARLEDDWVWLDFPARPLQECETPAGLLEALGVSQASVGRNQYDYLVEVADAEVVRRLEPDFNRLHKVDARGVMVTAESKAGGYDFISRFFAPRVGVNEDPVTGSAHCCLAPYWGKKLRKKQLLAFQASARGGELRLDWNGERVVLGGQAVTVLRGELMIEQDQVEKGV